MYYRVLKKYYPVLNNFKKSIYYDLYNFKKNEGANFILSS